MLASLADLGFALVAVAAALAVALSRGAALEGGQFVVGAVAGAELAAVTAIGCLWGWRGTPGLLLLDVRTERPVTLGRAVAFALLWLALSPLLDVPLLVGWRSRRLAERLAGSPLNSRQFPLTA